MEKCKNCGGEFEKRGNGKLAKKFCCVKCRNRYDAKKNYHKNKTDPKYKAKRKVYFNEWRKKNRLRFNEMMRPIARRSGLKQYWERKHLGLCTTCGCELIDKSKVECVDCRGKKNRQQRKNRQRKNRK